MTVEELIIYGKKHIHKDQAIIVLSTLLNINYFDIFLNLSKRVNEEKVKRYKLIIESIRSGKPIQYLLGETNFYGYTFKVNESVLIPRFETETLVKKTYDYIKTYFNENVNIVDIGTGSGAIAITLKKLLPKANVSAVDISKEALIVAKENANILSTQINFIEGNMLEPLNDKYDILISNPPYLKKDDELDKIVIENEPEIALFGGEDGLKYYREILINAHKVLKDKNMMAFEINFDQKEEVIKIVKAYFPKAKIECFKDDNNFDRYIYIFNNCE